MPNDLLLAERLQGVSLLFRIGDRLKAGGICEGAKQEVLGHLGLEKRSGFVRKSILLNIWQAKLKHLRRNSERTVATP